MNEKIEDAIDRTQQPDKPNSHPPQGPPLIQIPITLPFMEFSVESELNIKVPDTSPEGPHLFAYEFSTSTWRGIRLPLGTRWQLSAATSAGLWVPGAPS